MRDKANISRVVDHLKGSIGQEKIITENDILLNYSKDETSDISYFPDIVVRAQTVTDVSETLRICTQFSIPVVPRGAGTGVTGGAVAVNGGVVLSMEHMNRIIEIDVKNMIAVVEPGVITKDLQDAVLEHGLMYPPDPASLDSCSIGGNVASGAGGPRAVKYGTTKDYITGLEFVLPDGSIVTTGGKFVKNATGYNLIGILTGSEGTLAVITKIYLRLVPAPLVTWDLLISFKSLEDALEMVAKFIENKIVPATIEFMEKDTINLLSGYLEERMPFPDAEAQLLVQIDGHSNEEIDQVLHRLMKCIEDKNSVIVAESKKQKERIWEARRSIREAIKKKSEIFLAEDTVVPRSNIPIFLKKVKQYLNKQNLHSVMFGHAGDGNVHIDVLKGDMDYEIWKKKLPDIKLNIYKIALSHDGIITGEHGIGFLRKDYLQIALSNAEIELLKRIKQAFDPDLLLNPDKILKF